MKQKKCRSTGANVSISELGAQDSNARTSLIPPGTNLKQQRTGKASSRDACDHAPRYTVPPNTKQMSATSVVRLAFGFGCPKCGGETVALNNILSVHLIVSLESMNPC
jgi:predicted RNA-binding Zn-ribbon protein involved in translation (DUF1610 family)